MGRALKPTRRVRPRAVSVGDVVLVRSRGTGNLRWMIVDGKVLIPNMGAPYVWSGRWAFGGQWTIHVEHHDDAWYTVKHVDDAKRDRIRLETLRSGA